MKKSIGSWIALCFLFLTTQSAYAESGLVQISDHVYSYVDVKDGSPAYSYGANAGIAIGEDAILVVDTLVSAKEGKRLLRDIRAISDKPIKYIVNTHSHFDHTTGNSRLSRITGAQIIKRED